MKNKAQTRQPDRASPSERAERELRERQEEERELKELRDMIMRPRGLIGCGNDFTAALLVPEHRVLIGGDDRWGQSESASWTDVRGVFCGPGYVLGLTDSGCVRFAGRDDTGMRCDAEVLSAVTLLSCGARHAAALLTGGRVRCIGRQDAPCSDTEDWADIVDVCCGRDFTAGLTASGHVRCAGGSKLLRMKLGDWTGIAGLYADPEGNDVFGITKDGHAVSTARLSRAVRAWGNLSSLTVSGRGLWGITPGGSLYAAHRLPKAYADDMWDVASMSAGPHHAMTVDRAGHVEPLGQYIKNGRVLEKKPDGTPDFGETDPAGGSPLFDDFESVCDMSEACRADRQAAARRLGERLTQASRLERRLSCGDRLTAVVTDHGSVAATGGLTAGSSWTDVQSVSCGRAHLLALHRDGHVSADGNNTGGCCEVSDWTDVRTVLAVGDRSMALTRGGRVMCAGVSDLGGGDVDDWKDVVLLRGSASCTVGVDREGRIRISDISFPPDLLRGPVWENLADLQLSDQLIAGLSRDGRVAVLRLPHADTDIVQKLDFSVTEDWHDVRAISLGGAHIAALCVGGRVMTAGCNEKGQCDTGAWDGIAAVLCTDGATLGLTGDGNVLCAGSLDGVPADPQTPLWTDVCALSTGRCHAAALTASGHVMACGPDTDGQCTGTTAFPMLHDVGRTYGILPGRTHTDDHTAPDGEQTLEDAVRLALSGHEDKVLLRRRFACGLAHLVVVNGGRAVIADDRGGTREAWSGVTSVACTSGCTLAVANGRLVCTDGDPRVKLWAERLNRCLNPSGAVGLPKGSDTFKAVACSYSRAAALRGDGRVFTTGDEPVCRTEAWRRVTDAACGARHVAAVTSDGHCLAAGDDTYGQCDVRSADWQTLTTVSCGDRHTAALRRDGRVVAAGDNGCGQCDVGDLEDVVSLTCLPETTVCVHRDGHVTVRGANIALAEKASTLGGVTAVNGLEHRLLLLDVSDRVFPV